MKNELQNKPLKLCSTKSNLIKTLNIKNAFTNPNIKN